MAPRTTRTCSICDADYDGDEVVCPEDGGPLIARGDDAIDPMVGRDIGGRFRVSRLLGKGGMGAVYYAKQLVIDRAVAVKVLRASPQDPQGAARRFVREARLAASLSHPNIVTIHDFGQEPDGTLYVVMEFLEGQSLGALLDRGPLSPARAARIGAAICDALAHAHGTNIVHRDIKPENVVVTRADPAGDRLKVVDFGLARSLEDASTRITATGIIFGTAAYISPEVAVGRQAGPGADLYALGVMLYEMVEWRLPFADENPNALLIAHASRPPDPMSPAVPQTFREIVMTLLEKDPDVRPISAAEVRDALLLAASEPGADAVIERAPALHRATGGLGRGPQAAKAGEGDALPFDAGTGPVLGRDSVARRATLPGRGPSGLSPAASAATGAASVVEAPPSSRAAQRRWVPGALGVGVIGAAAAAVFALRAPAPDAPLPARDKMVATSGAPAEVPAPATPPPAPAATSPAPPPAPPVVTQAPVAAPAAAPEAPADRAPAPAEQLWLLDANVQATVIGGWDGQELGQTPLELTLPVSATPREFIFRRAGFREVRVSGLGGRDNPLKAQLVPSVGNARPRPQAVRAPQPAPKSDDEAFLH
jgi:tRNA A-37 threonylcarbamoyl transferase component Bud32